MSLGATILIAYPEHLENVIVTKSRDGGNEVRIVRLYENFQTFDRIHLKITWCSNLHSTDQLYLNEI